MQCVSPPPASAQLSTRKLEIIDRSPSPPSSPPTHARPGAPQLDHPLRPSPPLRPAQRRLPPAPLRDAPRRGQCSAVGPVVNRAVQKRQPAALCQVRAWARVMIAHALRWSAAAVFSGWSSGLRQRSATGMDQPLPVLAMCDRCLHPPKTPHPTPKTLY